MYQATSIVPGAAADYTRALRRTVSVLLHSMPVRRGRCGGGRRKAGENQKKDYHTQSLYGIIILLLYIKGARCFAEFAARHGGEPVKSFFVAVCT